MNYPFYFTWTKQNDAPLFEIDRAEGAKFILKDKSIILDMISTNFQASFGLSNKTIIDSIERQLKILPMASPKAIFNLKIEQTEKLIKFLKLEKEEGKIFYTTGGAEAIENALKMAREVTGRKYILARKKSYHGATMGALSVTGDWRGEGHFSLACYTKRIPEPIEDPELIRTRKIIKELNGKIAAFCLETISSMNGVIIPDKSWWDGIQELSYEFNIPLIIDEVSTGFGRTGYNFAFQDYNLKPDFVCMAKAITGGYIPFGALWTSKKFAKYYDDKVLNCGLTNYAHPLGLAAMKGVLDHFDDPNFTLHLNKLCTTFSFELKEIKKLPHVKEIRTKGLLCAILLDKNISWEDGLKAGIHIAVKENMIILSPPFVINNEELKDGMKRLMEIIL